MPIARVVIRGIPGLTRVKYDCTLYDILYDIQCMYRLGMQHTYAAYRMLLRYMFSMLYWLNLPPPLIQARV